MRAFIILSLVAVACAQYNYQAGGNNGGISGGFTGDNGIGGSGLSGFGNGGVSGGSGFGNDFNGGSGSSPAGSFDGGFDNGVGDFGSSSISDPSVAPQSGLANQIYTYTADENDFNDDAALRAAESVKKPTRVVFIRGPSNKGLEDALLSLSKLAAPQTAIYVLNKQSDIGDLANKLNTINKNNNNQPEVHFVKYRTPEDAANAQSAIQGQYDSLGGSSKSINGGVAPILNFASQAPVAAAPAASAPGNSYLPASVFRLFRK